MAACGSSIGRDRRPMDRATLNLFDTLSMVSAPWPGRGYPERVQPAGNAAAPLERVAGAPRTATIEGVADAGVAAGQTAPTTRATAGRAPAIRAAVASAGPEVPRVTPFRNRTGIGPPERVRSSPRNLTLQRRRGPDTSRQPSHDGIGSG